MMETMAVFNLVDNLWHGVLTEPEKGLGYPRMFTPYRRPYPTSDGHVCLLATTDRQWRNLFAAIDHPELADDPRFSTIEQRTANIHELYTLLAESMRHRSTAEWRARRDAGLIVGKGFVGGGDQPVGRVVAAIFAELLGVLGEFVEINNRRRIRLARVIAMQPHRDDSDILLARLDELLAFDGRQIDDL